MIAAAAAIWRATTAALPTWDLPPCECRDLVGGLAEETSPCLFLVAQQQSLVGLRATGQALPAKHVGKLCN